MYSESYKDQFFLLLKILPFLKNQDQFLIKGGTAINLFYRDFPRISVDIDLTCKAIESREKAISNTNKFFDKIEQLIQKQLHNAKITRVFSKNREYVTKIIVTDKKSIVKIEPNFIVRGTLFEGEKLLISQRAIEEFGHFIDEIPVASFNDVFAGKICAALKRQHPRDLFDVKLLLENEGIDDTLRKAVIVYLAGDAKPMSELLNPNYLEIASLYKKEFDNMTVNPVSFDELLATRKSLIEKINTSLTQDERKFLLSVKQGEPDYALLPFKNLDKLPALQWKLINIRKMDKKKREKMLAKLRDVLEV